MIIKMHYFHIAASKPITHPVNRENPIYQRCRGPYGNQAVHIGAGMEQRLEAHLIVFAVDVSHRQRQEELHKAERHGVFMPGEETRQRQAEQGPLGPVGYFIIVSRNCNRFL